MNPRHPHALLGWAACVAVLFILIPVFAAVNDAEKTVTTTVGGAR